MRGEKHDIGACSRNLGHNVFHRDVPDWRRRVKIFLVHGAPEALQLPNNVLLYPEVARSACASRTDGHLVGNILVGLLAIEAAGGFSGRRGWWSCGRLARIRRRRLARAVLLPPASY